MDQGAVLIGFALMVLGLVGYFGSRRVSVTALIPAFFGLAVVILGALAMRASSRVPAGYALGAVGLLGLLGSVSGCVGVLRLLAGRSIRRPGAAISKAIMALICLVLVAVVIGSRFWQR